MSRIFNDGLMIGAFCAGSGAAVVESFGWAMGSGGYILAISCSIGGIIGVCIAALIR